ncbi:MAG TPA: hypothetical protein DIS79_11610 [Bacteroidetes bacterium]|nr:hypothetical protein [Bacteroidota bacterium]HRK05933.1 hypothetical protein [Chlorobiota bacterium]
MELLVAILLYLGFIQVDNSYTVEYVNHLGVINQPTIQMVQSDPNQMLIVGDDYYELVPRVDVIGNQED